MHGIVCCILWFVVKNRDNGTSELVNKNMMMRIMPPTALWLQPKPSQLHALSEGECSDLWQYTLAGTYSTAYTSANSCESLYWPGVLLVNMERDTTRITLKYGMQIDTYIPSKRCSDRCLVNSMACNFIMHMHAVIYIYIYIYIITKGFWKYVKHGAI